MRELVNLEVVAVSGGIQWWEVAYVTAGVFIGSALHTEYLTAGENPWYGLRNYNVKYENARRSLACSFIGGAVGDMLYHARNYLAASSAVVSAELLKK